jgi:hypothetical protein
VIFLDGVKFVLREGFGIPCVFEVDSDRAESVKLELGKRQGSQLLNIMIPLAMQLNPQKLWHFTGKIC